MYVGAYEYQAPLESQRFSLDNHFKQYEGLKSYIGLVMSYLPSSTYVMQDVSALSAIADIILEFFVDSLTGMLS